VYKIVEYTEYEGDIKRISSQALNDIKKNKKIYRNAGKLLCNYINKNDITYFCISEGLTYEVAFSYLDDLESKFLRTYKEKLEKELEFTKDDSNKLETIIKEQISFYMKNPTYNKYDKAAEQLSKSVQMIAENERKLLERDKELETVYEKANSISYNSQIIHIKAAKVKQQEKRKRNCFFAFLCGGIIIVVVIILIFIWPSSDKK